MRFTKEEVIKAMDILDEEERNIINDRWGINTQTHTQQEVFAKYNITIDKLLQIEEKIVNCIRSSQ